MIEREKGSRGGGRERVRDLCTASDDAAREGGVYVYARVHTSERRSIAITTAVDPLSDGRRPLAMEQLH